MTTEQWQIVPSFYYITNPINYRVSLRKGNLGDKQQKSLKLLF